MNKERNLSSSHMDSSLDWDSIMFKELSFCMSVLSEKLVSDKFPMDLLESPIEVLANIKTELQVSCCMFCFSEYAVILGGRTFKCYCLHLDYPNDDLQPKKP